MLNLYVSIVLLFQTLTPTAASAEALKAPLDIAQIKKVSITGERAASNSPPQTRCPGQWP